MEARAQVKTFLARLALAGAVDPLGGTPADRAFEIYTAWLHHVLALVDQDKMQGYSSYLSDLSREQQEAFRGLSGEIQKDTVFDALLNDQIGLLTFAEPLYAQAPNSRSVLTELKRFIKITPVEVSQ